MEELLIFADNNCLSDDFTYIEHWLDAYFEHNKDNEEEWCAMAVDLIESIMNQLNLGFMFVLRQRINPNYNHLEGRALLLYQFHFFNAAVMYVAANDSFDNDLDLFIHKIARDPTIPTQDTIEFRFWTKLCVTANLSVPEMVKRIKLASNNHEVLGQRVYSTEPKAAMIETCQLIKDAQSRPKTPPNQKLLYHQSKMNPVFIMDEEIDH